MTIDNETLNAIKAAFAAGNGALAFELAPEWWMDKSREAYVERSAAIDVFWHSLPEQIRRQASEGFWPRWNEYNRGRT